ncbi:ATP-binding protein [Stigmatella sp. ncwal1]|uniref:ATP-binding protein n=1 Tax=Stigmatella ashevillensis TaxID=2995309 RepID=A0ABT5DEX0_9BACT|nr:ATP-binding protein [Stigmatella ashevillena]MDC0712148.1 ATP-binding protein [Stigmatella ashevillena]
MLIELKVYDFKSYREAALPLAELTVLIGANASGKSNLLEALQILSWLARGRRLSEILYALKDRQLDVRGPVSRLVHGDGAEFSLSAMLEIDGQILGFVVELGLEAQGLRIVSEALLDEETAAKLFLYRVDRESASPYSNEVQVEYNNFARGGVKPKIACINQQAIFTQLTTPARFWSEHKKSQERIPQASKQLQSALESILFLDPAPRRMRDYSFTVERTLQGDGSNVSAVLYDLCEKQQRKAEVLAFIRSLPEQDILDLLFLKGPRDEVMVQLTESFGGKSQTYEAALLSDGTLRVLAVAAAVLSVPEGSLVVIEEIDNGVHPNRARLLLENIQRVARARKLRVLLTTHNPALLDAIPVDAIPDVVACYRDPKEGDSRLMPLSKIPDYPELVAQGPVGQLVTRGILDRYLKFPKTPEDKAAQAQEVLAMLHDAPSEP